MASGADRVYVLGLTLLGRRELSEAQLRSRLTARALEPGDVDEAIERLKRERALDDRRTALACARTEVRLKHRGRLRVLKRVEALGIARAVAREAVAEVFSELDENELLEVALDRRLRRGRSLETPADLLRVQRYLMAQGFDADRVAVALRARRSREER